MNIPSFTPHPRIATSKAEFDADRHDTYYNANYPKIFADMAARKIDQRLGFKTLIKTDRFFIVYFIMGWMGSNHPFIVDRCAELQSGDQTGTIDIWAREHGKSTILTIAGTVQRIVNNPECTTGIFSFKKPAAEKFLDAIRKVLEMPIMYWVFPDILYEKPYTEASSWSLQGGIRVKRTTTSRKEHTVEAFGLVEGMPTGGHFDHRVYDDIETDDLATNPDQLDLCYRKFEMSRNLGSDGGTEQIIGTYYSHCGVLVKLRDKMDIHGNPMYRMRVYPATDDGTITGKSVFFSQTYLDSKKMDSTFNTQQLCNPTPFADIKLKWEWFKTISRRDLPKNRQKFIIIDPAGDKEVQSGAKNDSWAMICVGVEPQMDDLGTSNVFIEDMIVGGYAKDEAISAACNMYFRNGRIQMLAVEKVGNDTTYSHLRNALRARGVYLDIKQKGKFGGNLLLLSPAGKAKNYRIESALSWPLSHGRLHYCDDLDPGCIGMLETECNKFPFFHVDILDALAYLYDILADPQVMYVRTEYEQHRERPLKFVQLGAV